VDLITRDVKQGEEVMNKKDCDEYKRADIYMPVLCEWCVAKFCPERLFDYGWVKPREKARRVIKKEETRNEQAGN
jgi:hypothetical protein